MSVCSECCVLSGRGLCDELIDHPEESYRLWCVVVCDLENSRTRRPWPAAPRGGGRGIKVITRNTAHAKKTINKYTQRKRCSETIAKIRCNNLAGQSVTMTIRFHVHIIHRKCVICHRLLLNSNSYTSL